MIDDCRTEANAKTSDICERTYSPSSVHALFESFRSQAGNSLLFLKSVTKLSVHVRAPGSQSPQLLFQAAASLQVQRACLPLSSLPCSSLDQTVHIVSDT